jgi:hypothetical protein
LGNSRRLNYFRTSTPSRDTSHHHGQPIRSCRLWTCIDFHNNFEPTWCHVTFSFSFILLLCTFP